MHSLPLPQKIFESNLPKLLADVAGIDGGNEPVLLDLSRVQYWIPAAIVFMCAVVKRWMDGGREVNFNNPNDCPACGYLKRVDFFDHIGLKLPEHFTRRDSGTSFVEIQQVEPGSARLKDPLARRLAECLAGSTDSNDHVLRFSEYALGEIIANCQQHSESCGYVTAQYVASRDWARAGIADCGIGIRESFRRAKSPHYHAQMTDSEVLEMAMKPWVSSKRHLRSGPYGEPPNRGVGLKMIQNMLAESLGELFVASGNAWRHYKGKAPPVNGVLEGGRVIPGTLVSIRFDRAQIASYRDILVAAQKAIGLHPSMDDDRFFS
jgi:hypothetical protein